jgi:hypothetical protein
MVQGYEKRRHPRTEISAVAVLVATAKGAFLTHLSDLSRGGCRIAKPLAWTEQLRPPFRLYFIVDQDTVIDVEASLVRAADEHLAFQFAAGQPDEIEQLLYEARFIA